MWRQIGNINMPKQTELSVYACFRLVCPGCGNLLSSKALEAKRVPSAGGGNRTHTHREVNWILSPARLPISPLRHV